MRTREGRKMFQFSRALPLSTRSHPVSFSERNVLDTFSDSGVTFDRFHRKQRNAAQMYAICLVNLQASSEPSRLCPNRLPPASSQQHQNNVSNSACTEKAINCFRLSQQLGHTVPLQCFGINVPDFSFSSFQRHPLIPWAHIFCSAWTWSNIPSDAPNIPPGTSIASCDFTANATAEQNCKN